MDEVRYEPHFDAPLEGVVIGEHNIINIYQKGNEAGSQQPPQEVSFPLWNVPYRRNPFFTGREDLLKLLHDRLTTAKTATLTQVQAISGLGGIGKTLAAVEYAYRYQKEYQCILWVRAATRDTLIADFVTVASLLRLPVQGEQDQIRIVDTVKCWLAEHPGWLLILDNVDDLGLAREFLPATPDKGHILLTTRAQATGEVAEPITVEKLDQAYGMRLLLRRARVLPPEASPDQASEADRIGAKAIVEAMDGLPLALDQAGAYIEEIGCSVSDYVDLYQIHRAALLRERGSFAPDHPDSVSTTFSLAFQKVQEINPSAAELLRLCAFLHPDLIPEEFFTDYEPELDSTLKPLFATQLELNAAIKTLLKFSLMQRNTETRTLTIHRLVQAVLQDEMDEQTRRHWEELAVRSVSRSFPFSNLETWSKCQRCLPHTYVCAGLIAQRSLESLEATGLLYRMARYLDDRGQYAEAEPRYEQTLVIAEKIVELEHPQVNGIRRELASLYHARGKYVQAESLHLQVLKSYQKALGLEHPEVAHSLDDLAGLYRDQGKYKEAEVLYQRALKIRKKALGLEHKQVGATLNNLALLYYDQGRYAEAEGLYLQALKTKKQEPENIDLSSNLCNLAATYRVQGKYKDAELLSQRALAICERIQGPDHPEVAVKVNNLGIIYSDQGRYAEAEQLFRRAIEIREKAGEADHPWIAQSLSSLGALYSAQGKYVEAESLLKRAWAIGELGFGPTHPYVASYISNLAINYQRQSRYAEAEPLHLQAISIWESLGQEHLLLASTLMAYAALLRETKQESRALQLEARAREIQALILTKNMTDNKKGKQIGHSSKIRHNARRHSKERNLKSL